MGWDKPEKTKWGGYKKENSDGKGSIYSKDTGHNDVDRSNHVHFHKDGITIKRNKKHTRQIKKGLSK